MPNPFLHLRCCARCGLPQMVHRPWPFDGWPLCAGCREIMFPALHEPARPEDAIPDDDGYEPEWFEERARLSA